MNYELGPRQARDRIALLCAPASADRTLRLTWTFSRFLAIVLCHVRRRETRPWHPVFYATPQHRGCWAMNCFGRYFVNKKKRHDLNDSFQMTNNVPYNTPKTPINPNRVVSPNLILYNRLTTPYCRPDIRWSGPPSPDGGGGDRGRLNRVLKARICSLPSPLGYFSIWIWDLLVGTARLGIAWQCFAPQLTKSVLWGYRAISAEMKAEPPSTFLRGAPFRAIPMP